MTNQARGETSITVPGIGEVTLCLTMAGMAALEDAFNVDNIQDAVAEVSKSPSSRNMATVLKALMIGTEHEDVDIEKIRRWPITPAAITQAMGAMNASNDPDEAEAGNVPKNRKERRATKPKK